MSNYDVYPRGVSTDPGSLTGSGGITSTTVLNGPHQPRSWAWLIPAGVGGTADDVSLFVSALPVKCYILRVEFLASATVSAGTVTLRTATGAGGTALSAAVVAATAGAQTFSATAVGSTTPVALAADTSIYARRSDNTIGGILTVVYLPSV